MHGSSISSTPATNLDGLLARQRPVLLDGATGTELARRGVDTTLPLWSARALFDDRGLETLMKIHEDQASAGRVCLVAGGLAPLEDCYRPDLVPSRDDCLGEHRPQSELLASLGVDLIIIETMNSLREAEAALQAARETGLPVLLSLCPRPPHHLLSGEPLETALPRLAGAGGEALRGVLMNCATPEALEPIYPRFASLAPAVPHGLYAHLGEPDDVTGWRMPERHEPGAYAVWMEKRIGEGARFVGGCCGTTPDHIAALAERLGRLPG